MEKYGFVLLSLFLAGCMASGPKHISATEGDVNSAPAAVGMAVPFIGQYDDYSCATTSVAMAISHFRPGEPLLDKDQVWDLSGTAKFTVLREGNDMAGLERIAKHYGFKSEYLASTNIPTLEYLLSKGALVVLNIQRSRTGRGSHALLATGYDKTKRTIFVNDPAGRESAFGYDELNARWSANLSEPRGPSTKSVFVIYPEKR